MLGAKIEQINKAWQRTLEHKYKRGHREDYNKTCAYPFLKYDSTSGVMERETADCKMGPGDWCAICSRHTKHQEQRGKSRQGYLLKKKHILESYKKTGLVPRLRRDFDSHKRRVDL